jgi:hypothetical protein
VIETTQRLKRQRLATHKQSSEHQREDFAAI